MLELLYLQLPDNDLIIHAMPLRPVFRTYLTGEESMTRKTTTGKDLTDEQIEAIADDFATTDFTPEDVAKIKKTRRRSPRLGVTKAEVLTFRAPGAYKDRIKERADADDKSESQVIRDALDAYL